MQTCKLKSYPNSIFKVTSIEGNNVRLSWMDGVLEGSWMFDYQCNISETNLANAVASTVTYNHKDLNNQYNAKIKQAVPVYDDYDEDEDEEPSPRVKKSKPKVNKDFRYFVSRLERM